MLAGDFQRRLRRLNPKLRIWCGDDDSKPAGIFFVSSDGEYNEVCGIDKNYIPEHTIWGEGGFIAKGGWRRALKVLIHRKLVDRFHAERTFGVHLEYGSAPRPGRDPVARSMEDLKEKAGAFGLDIINQGEIKTK